MDSRTVCRGAGGWDIVEFLQLLVHDADNDDWQAVVAEVARIAANPRHRFRERASAILAGLLSQGSWTDDDDDVVAIYGADDA